MSDDSLGLIYRSPWLYNLFLATRYGKNLDNRYRPISDLITEGERVCELCCGPGDFYRYLSSRKNVTYLGIDKSARFVDYCKRKFASESCDFICGDILETDLGTVDSVLIQASFYHFWMERDDLLEHVESFGPRQFIVVEPLTSMTFGSGRAISKFLKHLSRAGNGRSDDRLSAEEIRSYFLSMDFEVVYQDELEITCRKFYDRNSVD